MVEGKLEDVGKLLIPKRGPKQSRQARGDCNRGEPTAASLVRAAVLNGMFETWSQQAAAYMRCSSHSLNREEAFA